MIFSERIQSIKPSPTLEVTALANALKAEGKDIIGFGSGEPDFDTPNNIKEAAIRAIENGMTKYTNVGGIPPLKSAIVEKFNRDNNLTYDISEITVNCGGKHSFYNLMQVIINPGDEVLIPTPYWVSYPSMVDLAGGTPTLIHCHEENNFKLTPEQLEKHISSRTKALVINSPSNPAGVTYSRQELEKLTEIALRHDILIISDDIYETILYDDKKFVNTAMLSQEAKDHTIVLNGVSKAYAMTGWRIGYMAAPAPLIKKIEILQSQSTSNPTSISQWAAIEALTGDQAALPEMLAKFTERRDLVVDLFNNIEGISCMKPEGAFYAFPKISDIQNAPHWNILEEKYTAHTLSGKIVSYLLEEALVALVPGIAFGNDSFMRMSFATSNKNIEEGCRRIKEAIDKLY